MRTITHPETGRSIVVGSRRRPVAWHPRLRMMKYMLAKLADPPASCDYMQPATAELAQILCNDRLGDCTAAGAFHLQGVFLAGAGMPVSGWTDEQVIAFYSATTGYNPADPSTDQGGDEETVLGYWQSNGLLADGSHKLAGRLAIDANDPQEVLSALWLFENLYFGVELPDAWVNPFPAGDGFTWDVAGDADPENGHCFIAAGYPNQQGVTIDTWGMLGTLSMPALQKYCSPNVGGQLFTLITQESLNRATQKAPNGMNWAQLVADFDSIGGNLKLPA